MRRIQNGTWLNGLGTFKSAPNQSAYLRRALSTPTICRLLLRMLCTSMHQVQCTLTREYPGVDVHGLSRVAGDPISLTQLSIERSQDLLIATTPWPSLDNNSTPMALVANALKGPLFTPTHRDFVTTSRSKPRSSADTFLLLLDTHAVESQDRPRNPTLGRRTQSGRTPRHSTRASPPRGTPGGSAAHRSSTLGRKVRFPHATPVSIRRCGRAT